jgi:hypothetical protein
MVPVSMPPTLVRAECGEPRRVYTLVAVQIGIGFVEAVTGDA